MKSNWLLFVLLGVLLIVGGAVALGYPFAASLMAASLIGAMFLIAGVAETWLGFTSKDDPNRIWHVVSGLMSVLAGAFLLFNPLAGALSLTLVLAVFFVITGVARLIVAWNLRQSPLFWAALLSGALSVLLGALILGNFAEAGVTFLGLVLALELIFEGAGLVALGFIFRKQP